MIGLFALLPSQSGYVWIQLSLSSPGMDDEDDETKTLDEVLNDETRVEYFKGYVAAVAQAIR